MKLEKAVQSNIDPCVRVLPGLFEVFDAVFRASTLEVVVEQIATTLTSQFIFNGNLAVATWQELSRLTLLLFPSGDTTAGPKKLSRPTAWRSLQSRQVRADPIQ